MARIPTQARRTRIDDDDTDEQEQQDGLNYPPRKKETPRQRVSLSTHLLNSVQLPKLGRPPKDEEEKLQVLSALVYLKSSGKTNAESAVLLDVSERTINNYMAEEKYAEIQSDMQADAKMRGHSTIAMLIDEALSELFFIMKSDKSGFVRFKAAEKLLDVAGYNMPREEQQKDSREEVNRFLQMIEERSRVQVNVQINQPNALPGPGGVAGETFDAVVVDEAVKVGEEVPEELKQYYALVGPGGTLPGTSRQREAPSHA